MKYLWVGLLAMISGLSNDVVHAEDLKHRLIKLDSQDFNIGMSHQGDLVIRTGVDTFDTAIVYREIFSYEQFHKEVVEVMESGSGPVPTPDGTVDILVKPMDPNVPYAPHVREYPAHLPPNPHWNPYVYRRYDATELWNGLLKKLLPAAVASKPDQVNRTFERRSPFIGLRAAREFGQIKVQSNRSISATTREEKVAQVMARLTPEQREALGHPRDYPPGIKQNEKSKNDREDRRSATGEPDTQTGILKASRWGKDRLLILIGICATVLIFSTFLIRKWNPFKNPEKK